MDATSAQPSQSQPTFAELFTPKSITVLREGYGREAFRADVISGLTVAIVALPLSMAIAIASGTTPDRGLYAAIFGGFLVSLLGGSRFQIGGPAGAFIVLVAASVARHGIEGVLLATMIAGLILIVAGFLKLGTYIKFIPYPVTVGFTAGIAVIIFASQIRDLLGITTPLLTTAPPTHTNVERLIEQVRAVGGTAYLSGTGGTAYMGEDAPDRFAAAGIELLWSDHAMSTGDSIVTLLMDEDEPMEGVLRHH